MKDALVLIAWAAGYGELMAILLLAAGIATMFFGPAWGMLGGDVIGVGQAVLLGLTATIAIAAISALIALLIPSRAARGLALRVIFLGLLILFFFDSQKLPEIVVSGTVVCAVVAVLALFALRGLLQSRDAQ